MLDSSLAAPAQQRRLIAIHAHPDDETTSNGFTLPKYAAQGAHVTLVTSNLGEEGEIVVPEFSQLGAAEANALGGFRYWELQAACAALGVSEHAFIGGPGRYRDSGMMGEPTNDNPRCFWQANLDEAAAYVVQMIRRNRPQVMLTYNENGGYGHPDHIQAHRVAVRARELAADPTFAPDLGAAWQIAKLYYGVIPRSAIARGLEHLRAAGEDNLFGITDAKDAPFATDDELVSAQISGSGYGEARLAAMRAHRTQISTDNPFFKFMSQIDDGEAWDYYQLADGSPGPTDPVTGREHDLFAGIDNN